MNCPNCGKAVDNGAAFCGNCGTPLQTAAVPPVAAPPTPVTVPGPPNQVPNAAPPTSPIGQVYANQQTPPYQPVQGAMPAYQAVPAAPGVPSYAVATPAQHKDETKAVISLVVGIIGIVGGAIIPILGLLFGGVGIVCGTMAHASRRTLSTLGIIFSTLAVLVGLAMWVYAIKHDPNLQGNSSASAQSASASASLDTPCYSTGFVDKLNITNDSSSCNMTAYNGTTADQSTNAYKVLADQIVTVNASNFNAFAKQALEKDVHDNLSGFTISNEQVGQFADSPAYTINTIDKTNDVAVTEAAVLHPTANGANVFVLVHAMNGSTADLHTLESQWQWK